MPNSSTDGSRKSLLFGDDSKTALVLQLASLEAELEDADALRPYILTREGTGFGLRKQCVLLRSVVGAGARWDLAGSLG